MIRNDMMHLEEVLIGTLISKREYRELIFNTLDATYFNYLRPIYLEACKQHVDGVVFNEDTLVAKMEVHDRDWETLLTTLQKLLLGQLLATTALP